MKNMKKKVLLAGMSLLVMTIVCYGSFHDEKTESALLMENIEALAEIGRASCRERVSSPV